jgi:hypothetical protein
MGGGRHRDVLYDAAPEMLEALEEVEKALELANVSGDGDEPFFLWLDANERASILVRKVLKRIRG